jgi:hypothetical protein
VGRTADAVQDHAEMTNERIVRAQAQRNGSRALRGGPRIEHGQDRRVERPREPGRRRRALIVAVEEAHHAFNDQDIRLTGRRANVTPHTFLAVEPQIEVVRGSTQH